MITTASGTQFHGALLPDGRWECSIHYAGSWLRPGFGDTPEQAFANARRSPAIAMGKDAPMLCDVARLYRGDGDEGGAA